MGACVRPSSCNSRGVSHTLETPRAHASVPTMSTSPPCTTLAWMKIVWLVLHLSTAEALVHKPPVDHCDRLWTCPPRLGPGLPLSPRPPVRPPSSPTFWPPPRSSSQPSSRGKELDHLVRHHAVDVDAVMSRLCVDDSYSPCSWWREISRLQLRSRSCHTRPWRFPSYPACQFPRHGVQ